MNTINSMSEKIDLNLLFILENLYKTQNVSLTAKELYLGQSAVSHALGRLRKHYNDELFVRVSRGMAPTKFALSIKEDVLSFTEVARKVSAGKAKFNPYEVNASITIATTEMIELLIGPQLICFLKKEAPGVRIHFKNTLGAFPKKELETAEIDIAIAGFFKDIPDGFFTRRVLTSNFVTCVRKGHEILDSDLSLEKFYELDHALITIEGDYKDQTSKKTKRVRNFKLGTSSFTSLAWIIAETDLVLTAPAPLVKKYCEYFPLKAISPPVTYDSIQINMLWHSLTNKDPLQKWIREKIYQIMKSTV